MKITFLVILSGAMICCSCSKSPESTSGPFTLDTLLTFQNADELGRAIADTTVRNTMERYTRVLFDSTSLAIEISWSGGKTKPAQSVTVYAKDGKYANIKRPGLPDVWRTRDGVYASIPIDSLQMING